jgi:hypothetical protein
MRPAYNLLKRSLPLLLAVAVLLAGLAGAAFAQGGYTLDRQVSASSGAHLAGGSFALDNTVGQAATGISQGGPYELCAGFWCNPLSKVGFRISLPMVHRSP